MNDVLIREVINLSWGVLTLALTVFFLVRTVLEARTPGFYNDLGNQLSVGFGVYFLGETIYRFWILALLLPLEVDLGPLRPRELYFVAVCGALISFFGALCVVRLFTREVFGNWGWFSLFVVVSMCAVGMRIIQIWAW